MHDLDSRPDIYPWLANLFVDEDYRLQGVATGLINQAINQSKKIGLKELYLYTKYTNLYEKFGFEFVEEVETFKKDSPIERLYKINL
jgi:N-acetylglutamate synthase-like GNAT family acetyltransferase